MCVVSNMGDMWRTDWPTRWPTINPEFPIEPQVTKEEFEKLRKEVKSLKKLLKAAKEYDEETGQPDCEMDEKVELIKRIADQLGVNMEEIFSV